MGAAPDDLIAQTPRLLLRRLRLDDATFVLDLVNEPSWLEGIGDRGVRTLEDARGYIERAGIAPHERHGFSLSCVVARESGCAVGLSGLVQREGLPAPDLGFALLERFTGRGLAREAAGASLDHAHSVLALPRVLAVTSGSNARSLKLLHALAFRDAGTFVPSPGAPALLLLEHVPA
jgi:ribosomal-protein-alanine N-acetyltransferase